MAAAAGFGQSVKQMPEMVGTGSKDTHPTQPTERREIRTVSESDASPVHVRSQDQVCAADAATNDGGTNIGPDPVAAFLWALLSCMTISFKARGRRRKSDTEGIERHVKAIASGEIIGIILSLGIGSPDSEEQARTLLERAER